MPTPPAGRKVKRLLGVLKQMQKDDAELTHALMMDMKYTLPYHSPCARVRVIFEKDTTPLKRLNIPRPAMLKFLSSQLEFWKITDVDSDIVDILLPLASIWAGLKEEEGQYIFPTVFVWPDPTTRRTLHFFAYINYPMKSKAYTFEELLACRHKAKRPSMFRGLALDHPDLASYILPKDSRENMIPASSCSKDSRENMTPASSCSKPADDKAAMNNRDDDSSSSDEVLFKGTASRRQATARATITNYPTEPKTDTAYKYRGRNDSDPSQNVPLSAPGDPIAQKSEGFQRFYKAVVSPTHVRVTAGGRIVPNTRGLPSSPTIKRAHGASVTGLNGSSDRATRHGTPPAVPMGARMGPHVAPAMPQYLPGYAPGFQSYTPQIPQMPQMPYFPTPFGHPMGGNFPLPPGYPMAMVRNSPAESTLKDTLNLSMGDGQVDKGDEPQKTDKVQAAPEIQFDTTRKPFFCNGQWFYPVLSSAPPPPGTINAPYMPMPHMPMPMQMGGAVGSPVAPHMPVSMMQPPASLGGPMSIAGPVGPAGSHPTRPQATPNLEPRLQFVRGRDAFQAPRRPPISSIRPSEITRKQIGIFRKSLKYHEDQLQYNRHQIDEKDTEQKIQKYRDNIRRFEDIMEVQIEDERNQNYPPITDKEKDSNGLSGSDKKSSSTMSEDAVTIKSSEYHSAAAAAGPPVPVIDAGHHTTSGEAAYDFALSRNGQEADNGTRKTSQTSQNSLPTGAALAAPFEPRKETPTAPAITDGINPIWRVPPYSSQGVDGYSQQYMGGALPWPTFVPKPEAHMFTNPAGRPFDPSVTSVPSKGYLGVPYLIGTLPKGMNNHTASDIDYQYSRELTEDEIRARHLYWGKAPHSVVRGLPKYDGRNFYPPSPVKDADSDMAALRQTVDLLSMTPKQIGSEPETQAARPSTPVGSALIPCDSFEHNSTGTQVRKISKGISEAAVDSASVSSHDRYSEKPGGPRLWEAMLKKGQTSSASLSAATAEGQLRPQYAGSAAASLSPTLNRGSDHAASVSPGKDSVDNSDGGALLTPAPERRGKNRALNGEASQDQLAANGSGSSSFPTALGA